MEKTKRKRRKGKISALAKPRVLAAQSWEAGSLEMAPARQQGDSTVFDKDEGALPIPRGR